MQFCTSDIDLLDQIYQYNPIDPELAQVAETLYVLNELGQFSDSRSRVWKRAMATVEELQNGRAQELTRRIKQSAPLQRACCPWGPTMSAAMIRVHAEAGKNTRSAAG